MVFDASLRQCLLVGLRWGGSGPQPQAWTWDGAKWTQLAAPPPLRDSFGMAYDYSRRQTMLFGGRTMPYTRLSGATWVFRARSLTARPREVAPGQTASWDVLLPNAPQHAFIVGLSEAAVGIPVLPHNLGAPVLWPLAADRMFDITFALPTLVGFLDQRGAGTATLAIPNDATLDGLRLFASALTIDPSRLVPTEISQGVQTLIVR